MSHGYCTAAFSVPRLTADGEPLDSNQTAETQRRLSSSQWAILNFLPRGRPQRRRRRVILFILNKDWREVNVR